MIYAFIAVVAGCLAGLAEIALRGPAEAATLLIMLVVLGVSAAIYALLP